MVWPISTFFPPCLRRFGVSRHFCPPLFCIFSTIPLGCFDLYLTTLTFLHTAHGTRSHFTRHDGCGSSTINSGRPPIESKNIISGGGDGSDGITWARQKRAIQVAAGSSAAVLTSANRKQKYCQRRRRQQRQHQGTAEKE